MELMEGDTIVMGSDGLFDNVFDDEIVSTMARHKDVIDAGMCFSSQSITEFISHHILN